MITLDSLDLTSEQEVFNYVANHLLTQGKQAKIKHPNAGFANDVCAYRSGELKCAAGCLIRDDEYQLSMENKGIGSVVDEYAHLPGIARVGPILRLLTNLQSIHDRNDPAQWPERLQLLATRFGLDYAPTAMKHSDSK